MVAAPQLALGEHVEQPAVHEDHALFGDANSFVRWLVQARENFERLYVIGKDERVQGGVRVSVKPVFLCIAAAGPDQINGA